METHIQETIINPSRQSQYVTRNDNETEVI